MKQTANARNYAVRAVVPRIRNAGTSPMFIAASDNLASNNATFGGTNRDFNHNQTLRFALRGIKALEGIAVNSGFAK